MLLSSIQVTKPDRSHRIPAVKNSAFLIHSVWYILCHKSVVAWGFVSSLFIPPNIILLGHWSKKSKTQFLRFYVSKLKKFQVRFWKKRQVLRKLMPGDKMDYQNEDVIHFFLKNLFRYSWKNSWWWIKIWQPLWLIVLEHVNQRIKHILSGKDSLYVSEVFCAIRRF